VRVDVVSTMLWSDWLARFLFKLADIQLNLHRVFNEVEYKQSLITYNALTLGQIWVITAKANTFGSINALDLFPLKGNVACLLH
jgi:hypothetical protein